MSLRDHNKQHNKTLYQIKSSIIELNTSDSILPQNKLLTQIVDELEK